MSENGFRAAGFPWRLYCGPKVLEQNLKEAVTRAGARRAFVICSPSITRRTDTVARIAAALGDLHAGVFDAVEVEVDDDVEGVVDWLLDALRPDT